MKHLLIFILALIIVVGVVTWAVYQEPDNSQGYKDVAHQILERNQKNYGHLPHDQWPEDIKHSDEVARKALR